MSLETAKSFQFDLRAFLCVIFVFTLAQYTPTVIDFLRKIVNEQNRIFSTVIYQFVKEKLFAIKINKKQEFHSLKLIYLLIKRNKFPRILLFMKGKVWVLPIIPIPQCLSNYLKRHSSINKGICQKISTMFKNFNNF